MVQPIKGATDPTFHTNRVKIMPADKNWSGENDVLWTLDIPPRIYHEACKQAEYGLLGGSPSEVMIYWLREGCIQSIVPLEQE